MSKGAYNNTIIGPKNEMFLYYLFTSFLLPQVFSFLTIGAWVYGVNWLFNKPKDEVLSNPYEEERRQIILVNEKYLTTSNFNNARK